MEQTAVQKLARILRVMAVIVFVCNLVALLLVPPMVALYSAHVPISDVAEDILHGGNFFFEEASPLWMACFYGWMALASFAEVWQDASTAVLTLFLWACGTCTAVILWQGKRVLDTILQGDPFTLGNARSLKRAAVCCFIISGAALARLVWGIAAYQSIAPLFSYNALFIPLFLMAGLLCMIVSALFRQAAELKAENDLTI